MKTKYKVQIISFLLASIIIIIVITYFIFNKKPYRKEDYLQKKQRIILPFKQLKEKYQ